MALLQLDNVMAFYEAHPGTQRRQIRIEAGEIVCLLGGNASGKSTTMKTILGMVRAASGTYSLLASASIGCQRNRSLAAASRGYPRRAAYSGA
jgi:branched-chain amino acid transport system ATP-binding protein